MNWDYEDMRVPIELSDRSLIGADVSDVFLEDSRHRSCDATWDRHEAHEPGFERSRDIFQQRSRADAVELSPTSAVDRAVEQAFADALQGAAGPGVEIVIAGDDKARRIVGGTGALVAAYAPGSAPHECNADAGPSRVEIAIVIDHQRLATVARSAGLRCSPSRALRQVLLEAGAVTEAVARQAEQTGLEPRVTTNFDDIEAPRRFGLSGPTTQVVAVVTMLDERPQ